jgi:hypothetical protein
LAALPAHIGIRETHHACCLHALTEEEVLLGKRFDDAIANGSYCVDVHHSNQQGITFRYLDGREIELDAHCHQRVGRWHPETAENPTFYQIPYRSLVPQNSIGGNVLVAGRLIDANRGAYGAIRVIVNCNQTGEAAGVAAVEALHGGVAAEKVDPVKLRAELAKGGAAVL